MKTEHHIVVEIAGAKPVDLIGDVSELSRSAIKQAMKKGAVWLTRERHTQRLRRADKALRIGDTLHLYHDDAVLSQQAPAAELIADEVEFSIWYKPYGMLSQGSKWGDHCTINRWVEQSLTPQRPAFLTHRLDRAASGLMIIAHRKQTAAYFARQFRERQVGKRYRAIVHGQCTRAQTITSPIDGKPATSHITPVSYVAARDQSLLDIEIESGRKHQIRRHLAEQGLPIVGDRLYGRAGTEPERDLCLVSCHLAFHHPRDGTDCQYNLPDTLLPAIE